MFNYAAGYGFTERALAAWPAAERWVLGDKAVEAARLNAEAGRGDEAWAVLERKVAHFWPVDVGQIAPLEPLVSEALAPLGTPERLERLLTTPKGQEL